MRTFLVATVLVSFSVCANASRITFELSGAVKNSASFSVTNRGVTLSFFDPNLDGLFDSDSDGIAVLDATGYYFPAISEFKFSFDENVSLSSYYIGYLDDYGDESFTISGANGTTTESGPFDLGERDFNTSLIANAGEVLTFSSNPGAWGDGVIQLYSLEVNTVELPPVGLVEPATLGLLTLGLAGIGFTRRRRQA